ncbi:uncharacterized protein K444DRAFT_634617 [Hyaloscypha bicolor E]|uniref:Uncharacterized protein n=1 Tax=Hyaloscypha bicolor E TaxID=1095630 RepID=A0A2J6SUL5_9HELO|nr:uncharacterized protein K444DRAFT_634617 [Hyaloscypha bicolor E]PMD54465.1 hypothetical protein K444DRAFT_634617 [Hyaloscypha bicolor E]
MSRDIKEAPACSPMAPVYSPMSLKYSPTTPSLTPTSPKYSPTTPVFKPKTPEPQNPLATVPSETRQSKLYRMDCCQCGGGGYSQFPYPACQNCGHDQCDACTGNS